MEKILSHLLSPTKLWSRSEILHQPSLIPANPGLYAWYFKGIPSRVPTEGCLAWKGSTLLYVGISPSKPTRSDRKSSQQNLRKRIRYHLQGNAFGSTLRKSLGCLLSETLGIRLQQVGSSGKQIHFAEG